MHLLLGVSGGAIGYYTGTLYDDVDKTMSKQYSSVAKLPYWARDQLSQEELDKELRQERVAEMNSKLKQLAKIEETLYLERTKANKLQ